MDFLVGIYVFPPCVNFKDKSLFATYDNAGWERWGNNIQLQIHFINAFSFTF